MTNEEIIEQTNTLNADKCGAEYCVARVRTAIDLARADERAKLAGLYFSKEAVDAMIAEEKEKVKSHLLDLVLTDAEFEEYTGSKRAKLSKEAVKVWCSWDEGNFESPTVTTKQPKANKDSNGRIYHTDLGQNFTIKKEDAVKLNLKQGECKAFEIRECES